jgi:hypothetical protein
MWIALGAIWLLRVGAVLLDRRWPTEPAGQLRWLGIPLLVAVVFAVTVTDVLYEVRVALSRGAMDAMVTEVMSGGSTDRKLVGLYYVEQVQLTRNGLRFVVDDSLLGRWGFAYAEREEPDFIQDDEEAGGLWTEPSFTPIGDGWWRWSEFWD